ncbi:nitroreductase family protein [bacterium 210820-DFI.6.37]|nr:nitroreductase family protein [bacterium 210820-DFI.6.37]
MIQVRKEKCIGCLACIRVCPFTVLTEEEGRPRLREGKVCLKCMHCAAACPERAITFDGKEAVLHEPLPVLPEGFPEALESHIMTRRSYRHFKKEAPDREVVRRALDVASWAPSAKNQHPAKWIVIDSEDVIERIMEYIVENVKETGTSPEIVSELKEEHNNVVMGNAPMLILCYGRNNAINSPADTAIAMTTAELALQARGIGTCWAGYLTRFCNSIERIRSLLPELPENNSFYGAFMVGYPQGETYHHIPERLKRADIQWV